MHEIIVGFDGSESSMRAVRWAAGEAHVRGAPLRIVQSWRERLVGGPALAEAWVDPEGEERGARTELDSFVHVIEREQPEVQISADLVGDQPVKALLGAAEGASLLVVGSRGQGGFASLLLGSVSRRVAAAAPCPVVVVRGATWSTGPIVVGVDGSQASRTALAWAAQEAEARNAPVRAVLAWTDLVPVGDHGAEPLRAGYTPADARITLRRIVDEVLDGRGGLDLELVTSADRPARALVEASQDAALVVVGSTAEDHRRLGDLGSVTWQVLHHAPCSVAVIRAALA